MKYVVKQKEVYGDETILDTFSSFDGAEEFVLDYLVNSPPTFNRFYDYDFSDLADKNQDVQVLKLWASSDDWRIYIEKL